MKPARWLLPWLALAALFALAPRVFASGTALTMMSVMGTMIIFALSYNILLGQTGLLSFGHAVYYGLGGFVAIHAMNGVIHAKLGVPVAIIPLVGGLAGLAFGFLFGLVSTRRAGIIFSMISLGLGELVSSSSFILRTFFGGEAGITTNRAKLAPLFGYKFGPQIEVYYLIAVWCFLCIVAMYALTRTPFGRIVQRGARQSRARRIRRLLAAHVAPDRLLLLGLLCRNRRRPRGDQFRDHERPAARRAAVELRAADGLYRRRRRVCRADRRGGDHHLPAGESVRRLQRLAALFRPHVHRRRALCAGRFGRMGDAALARRGAG